MITPDFEENHIVPSHEVFGNSGIYARRCKVCNKILFVNQSELDFTCSRCRPEISSPFLFLPLLITLAYLLVANPLRFQ
jgi:hypothetical protein